MITGSIYFNGDDCFLAWSMSKTNNCWGFAIWREITYANAYTLDNGTVRPAGSTVKGYLHNRTGFAGDDNAPHSHKPSSEWPFQRYTWTDHGVSEGDKVSYIIRPVMREGNALVVDEANGKKLGPVKITGAASGKTHAYFNRGVLLSQFMLKHLPKDWTKSDLAKLKKDLKADDSELRAFLTGQLGAKLVELLATAKKEKWHVYAALYELEDEVLVAGLKALGKKAHIVLSNGSSKAKDSDGNEAAAAELVNTDLTRRMLWSEGLGHNKFVVFADADKKPMMVWTGSTNWATTGLCTQLNNGLLVENPEMAEVYKAHWDLLKDDHRVGRGGADMHFGEDLTTSNDEVKEATGRGNDWSVWFTRTSDQRDLEAIKAEVNKAKKAILFLMFEPGGKGVLPTVQARQNEPGLYVHGVVNTLKPGAQVAVDLVSNSAPKKFDLDVVQPQGTNGDLANWAKEVMRKDFLLMQGGVIGYAIIHSKMIVIDPFTDPVVITGSHNFSLAASEKNDENFVIIRGNKELAQRYAVHIMGNYQHYRWRAYLQECRDQGIEPWEGLKKNANWQPADLASNRELAFWVR